MTGPTFLMLTALHGCGDSTVKTDAATVEIAGRTFHLEIAADDDAQSRGLSGRTHIADDGGMIFVFADPQWHEFVMRDCVIPLDILYVDDEGRVVAAHVMQPEPPRGPHESADVPAEDFAYNARLTPYPSGKPCRFAIEIRGGVIEALNIKDGDHVVMDIAMLRSLAK